MVSPVCGRVEKVRASQLGLKGYWDPSVDCEKRKSFVKK